MKNNLSILKDAIILFIITIVLGILLSFTKLITDEPINRAKINALNESYRKVLNEYSTSDDITRRVIDNNNNKAELVNCLKVYNNDNENIGYIVLSRINGYGGKIDVLVGFDLSLNITGIEFPSSLSETPGIGMNITSDEFKNSFINKNISDIKSIDTITGATISSTAVKDAVSFSLDIVQNAAQIE